ncbi:hypothetical protein ACFS5N_15040 [Mucilaginibacter ximonensis]|uniref:Outer membrane protein beta-barrel domain-containing protein n=1 Tax=Mucilaginibacter ximonensis TaxID=538021 RepID=A0ABW5YFH8_9SPHI
MKKLLLSITFICAAVVGAFAQKTDAYQFSVGLEGGLPFGSARNISTFVIGGSLKYAYPVCAATSLTVSAGYTYFPYRGDITSNYIGYAKINSGEGFVPLKAGVKYFLNSLFYAEGQLGAVIPMQSGESTKFAYAPGVGFQFDNRADLGLRYEGWSSSKSTINQVAVRLAYSF